MTYRGYVKAGTIVLDPEVQLPEGTEVIVEPVTNQGKATFAEQLGDLIGSVPDLPPNMAERHDDYHHGVTKC